jgi:hypothetical protein
MDRQVKGILGAKLGMTQVWDNNKVVPVTVVQAGPCVVTQVRTPDKDGYSAVQLAFGAISSRKVNKPTAGQSSATRQAPQPRSAAVPRRSGMRQAAEPCQEFGACCAFPVRARMKLKEVVPSCRRVVVQAAGPVSLRTCYYRCKFGIDVVVRRVSSAAAMSMRRANSAR